MDKDKLAIKDLYDKNLSRNNSFEKKQSFYRTKVLYLLPILFLTSIFIFKSKVITLHSSRLIFIILFSLIAFFIVILMWYEDLIHLERLRITYLSHSYKLEEQYKWLPRFTHNTIVYRKKFDSPHQKALQYIAVGSIIFIGMGIAGFFLANVYIGTYAYFVILPVLMLIVGYWFLLRKLSGRFEDIFNNKNKQSI